MSLAAWAAMPVRSVTKPILIGAGWAGTAPGPTSRARTATPSRATRIPVMARSFYGAMCDRPSQVS